MNKPPMADDRSQLSAQRIHTLLLFLLGIAFMALGIRSYPAFIAVGLLFILVSYRGFTATKQDRKTPDHTQAERSTSTERARPTQSD